VSLRAAAAGTGSGGTVTSVTPGSGISNTGTATAPVITALSSAPSQTTVATPGTALTTATPANVTSKSLTAGTYLVWGSVDFLLTAATTSEFRTGISATSATLPTQPGSGGVGPDALSVLPLITTLLSDVLTDGAGPTIVTLAATTTIFLVAQATFTAGTLSAFGTLSAIQLK
jgi:hypothetical protein